LASQTLILMFKISIGDRNRLVILDKCFEFLFKDMLALMVCLDERRDGFGAVWVIWTCLGKVERVWAV